MKSLKVLTTIVATIITISTIMPNVVMADEKDDLPNEQSVETANEEPAEVEDKQKQTEADNPKSDEKKESKTADTEEPATEVPDKQDPVPTKEQDDKTTDNKEPENVEESDTKNEEKKDSETDEKQADKPEETSNAESADTTVQETETEAKQEPGTENNQEDNNDNTEEDNNKVTEVSATVKEDAKNSSVVSGTCGDNITWSFEDGALTISGSGEMSNWTWEPAVPWKNYTANISSVVLSGNITSLGDYAFYGCSSLESIIIPDSVTSIGNSAFYGCSSLESITIPDSVTSIGNNAFRNCSSLTSITIPDSVTSIGYSAFSGCSNLTSITIPDSVTSIGNYAFYDCSSLTSITIPDSVTSIGNDAFRECTNLVSITIPDNVTSIGDYAFYGCSRLTSIKIPDSVTSIGVYAFYNCSALKDVYYSGTSVDWGKIAKGGTSNNNLTNATIHCKNAAYGKNPIWTFEGSTLTISDSGAMSNWTSTTVPWKNYTANISSVVISGDIASIGDYAFYGCSSLTSITIPGSVTSIGNYAFYGCSALKDVYYSGTGVNWGKITKGTNNNNLTNATIYYKCGNNLTWYFKDGTLTISGSGEMWTSTTVPWKNYTANISSVVISGNITSLGDYAFYGCSSLTSITIPDSVTSIGNSAFYGCSSLTSITIPDSVTSIGNSAFCNCSSLTSITIPDSVTSIGSWAFYNCSSLTSITIPDSVTSIGDYAFYGCSSLTSITIPDSVTSIGDYAFSGCSSLTSITISNSVTSISYRAFYGCSSLTSITIPDSVTSIGNDAFRECTNLVSITIPDSVTSIGGYAFYMCHRPNVYYLGTIDNWKSISIANVVFSDCTIHFKCGENLNLTWFFKDGTLNISGSGAMSNWTSTTVPWKNYTANISSVVLSGNITSLGDYAFYGCSRLTSITIPDSVRSIGDYAFYNCSALKDVYYSGTSVDWGKIATGSNNNNLTNAFIYCNNAVCGKCGENLIWTFEGSILTISGSGAMSNWTSTTVPWKNYTANISSVVLSGNITSIGDYAFYGCSSLTSITIPDSVRSIGDYAFYNCSALKYVYYSGTSVDWGKIATGTNNNNLTNAFIYCNNAVCGKCGENLIWTFEGSILTISGSGAMSNWTSTTVPWKDYTTNISSVVISGDITSIGGYAFYNCSSLTSITIPSSVTLIGNYAFSNCSDLKHVYYSGTIVDWGKITKGTDNNTLANATIHYKNGVYGKCGENLIWTFEGSKLTISGSGNMNDWTSTTVPWKDFTASISSVVFTGYITSIGSYAFSNCTSLTNISIPESVTSIGDYAFCNCSDTISVYYSGTIVAWGKITKGKNNDALTNATICYKCGDNLYFSFAGGTLTISGSGNMDYWTSTTVPWKDYTANIRSVVFSGDITSVGDYAFYNCSSLESITIPNSVTSIGIGAFYNCSNLTSITIPSSVTSIGGYAFYGCSSLTNITIPDSVTSIGDFAFCGCSNLTNITIPDSVTSIGYGSFIDCSNLTSITIPDSVTSIGDSAFSGCSNLTSITIPSSVTSIGDYAFYGCSNLTSITIPDNVTSISDYAFCYCKSLISITIPDSVTSIGDCAFGGCSSLKDVYYSGTFVDWNNITKATNYIDFTNVAIHCKNGVYGKCGENLIWTFEGSKLTISGSGNMDYWTSTTVPWKDYTENISSVVFTGNITYIGSYAFYNCSSLESITIPDSVTSIGSSAFYYCSSLESITIPSSVTSIGDYAFYGCSSLTSITIPDSVINIYDYAFSGCSSLTSITISGSVIIIYDYAFSGCSSLKDVYYGGSISTWNTNTQGKNNDALINATIHFKCGENLSWSLKDGTLTILGSGEMSNWTYYTVPWKDYKANISSVIISGDITSISDFAFHNCSSLESITIPDSVTSIGSWAFYNCSSLTNITIPDSVTSIGDSAFCDCKSLISITIPDSVTSIGSWAFYNCSSLTSITIPDSVISIDDVAFYNCSDLKDVYYSGTITDWNNIAKGTNNDALTNANIHCKNVAYGKSGENLIWTLEGSTLTISGSGEMSNWTSTTVPWKDYTANIRSVVFSGDITSVGDYAFYNCSSLESITIPNSVTIIGLGAFSSSGLKEITYDGSEIEWGEIEIVQKNGIDTLNNASIKFLKNSIVISTNAVTMAVKGTYNLSATGSSEVGYKTSNKSIATVSAAGVVKSIKPGTVTITAYLKDDPEVKATCKVTVKYKINYNLNGGTNNPSNLIYYTGTFKLKNPTKQYYTFKGWYTSSNYKTKTKVTSVKNANKTVYAKWAINTYTVKFNPNGGSGKAYTQKCTVTKTATLTANKFSRKGYTFVGWNTKADGSGIPYTNKQEILNLTTSNGATVNLYAQWSINTYTISYNGLTEGDTNPNVTTIYQVTTPDIKLLSAARTNYTFNGWYTDTKYKTKVTTIKKGSTGNKTYYAKFTLNTYTVKFNPNGGSGKAYTQKFSVTKQAAMTANKFSRKGYTFIGWNTKADGTGDHYDNKQEILDLTTSNGKTINFYAQWRKNTYTINYAGLPAGATNPNPTSYTITSSTIKFKNPSVPGYSFKGWYTNTKYKTKATQITKGSTGTKTIYAKVVANKYNIIFNANGGTGSVTKMTNAVYGKTYNLRANAFVREGYEFTGWNTQPDGSGTSYADMESVMNLTTKNGGTVTLYAQWIPLEDQPVDT